MNEEGGRKLLQHELVMVDWVGCVGCVAVPWLRERKGTEHLFGGQGLDAAASGCGNRRARRLRPRRGGVLLLVMGPMGRMTRKTSVCAGP